MKRVKHRQILNYKQRSSLRPSQGRIPCLPFAGILSCMVGRNLYLSLLRNIDSRVHLAYVS